jgi:hypothetical protein
MASKRCANTDPIVRATIRVQDVDFGVPQADAPAKRAVG